MRTLILLSLLVLLPSLAHALIFDWELDTHSNLSSYRLFRKVGPCQHNPNLFYRKKMVGLVSSTTYAPTTSGPNCFGLKAVNKAGRISKMSDKVQVP